MKKTAVYILAVLALALLAGCGEQAETDTQPTPSAVIVTDDLMPEVSDGIVGDDTDTGDESETDVKTSPEPEITASAEG